MSPFSSSRCSSSKERSKWSSIARFWLEVTMMTCSIPAATASSTAYWMIGLSTSGSISLGWALVAGRKRVPQPAAGKTALRTRIEPQELGCGRSSQYSRGALAGRFGSVAAGLGIAARVPVSPVFGRKWPASLSDSHGWTGRRPKRPGSPGSGQRAPIHERGPRSFRPHSAWRACRRVQVWVSGGQPGLDLSDTRGTGIRQGMESRESSREGRIHPHERGRAPASGPPPPPNRGLPPAPRVGGKGCGAPMHRLGRPRFLPARPDVSPAATSRTAGPPR